MTTPWVQRGPAAGAHGSAGTRAELERHVVPVLRLSLGYQDGYPRTPDDWWATYRCALRERCASLVWTRCGGLIRSKAPGDLVAAWRTTVVRQHDRGAKLLVRAGATVTQLVQAGVPVVVLKGAPLSERLYGDPLVRPADDLDLLVPRERWDVAAGIITNDGWIREQGTPGWSEIYCRPSDGEQYRLDLQSSLFVDHLQHLPPVAAKMGRWKWGDLSLPVHVGPEVALFLAVHLLKHQLAPLLWIVDFRSLWEQLSPMERQEAWRLATASRAHRYLGWAVERASHLDAAAKGEPGALQELGLYPGFRRDSYGMVRLTRMAATPTDMLAVVGAWVWPRPMRYDWQGLGRMWRRRANKRLASVFTARRHYLDASERSDVAAPSLRSQS